METKDALLIILPLISVVIGAWVTYFFTEKSKKYEAMLKFKEEKYTNLLILLQGFVGQTTSGDLKQKFFEEQYKSWLYSSDEVVAAINEMIAFLIKERGNIPYPEQGKKIIGNIVLQMRKDLLGKTNLKPEDFIYVDVVK
jgi:hypothetical protein